MLLCAVKCSLANSMSQHCDEELHLLSKNFELWRVKMLRSFGQTEITHERVKYAKTVVNIPVPSRPLLQGTFITSFAVIPFVQVER